MDGMVMIANNTFKAKHNIMLVAKAYDMEGKSTLLTQVFSEIEPTKSKKYLSLKNRLDEMGKSKGVFLYLQLLNENKEMLSDNLYWLPDSTGNYSGLQQMKKAAVSINATEGKPGKIEVTIDNPENNPVAFFNRISVVNSETKKRILPVFYSDNYVSVLPGEKKIVTIDFTPSKTEKPEIEVYGWNVAKQIIPIK